MPRDWQCTAASEQIYCCYEGIVPAAGESLYGEHVSAAALLHRLLLSPASTTAVRVRLADWYP